MEVYEAHRIAGIGMMLGQVFARTAFIESMPDAHGKLIDHVAETVMSECKAQLAAANVNATFTYIPAGSLPALAEELLKSARKESRDVLDEAVGAVEKMRMPERWAIRLNRIIESINESDAKALVVRLEDLQMDLIQELKGPLFLHVPPNKKSYFVQTECPFGLLVLEMFPSAEKDIAAAGRCFALDEWTACVLHLMRAVEPALQWLCGHLGDLSFPMPELESWKNLVDAIDASLARRLKALENSKKSIEKNEQLQQLSDMSLQLRHFKNIWRNGGAHGRGHYDERDAERAWTAVKDFMQTMAAFAADDAVAKSAQIATEVGAPKERAPGQE
jgi:hypothetical protein